MSDELELIDQVIAEHQINVLPQRVRNSIGEFDALFTLQEIQLKCKQSSVKELINQKGQLKDDLSLIQKRLDNHYLFEENALRPLFGDVFMKAIILQHNEIRRQLEKVMLMINDCILEGLNKDDLSDKKFILQDTISDLCFILEQHANLEEQTLLMLRKVFQVKAEPMKV